MIDIFRVLRKRSDFCEDSKPVSRRAVRVALKVEVRKAKELYR